MWSRNSAWFDLAVIHRGLCGRRRLFRTFRAAQAPVAASPQGALLVSTLYVWLAQDVSRTWAYGFLSFFAIAAAIVHLWWLPKHGINGWTAEPYDQYLALVTRRASRKGPA